MKYDLKKMAPKIKKLIQSEFGFDDINFLLCIIIPEDKKPDNTVFLNPDSTHVINYISTLKLDENNLNLLNGIKRQIIFERKLRGIMS